MRSSIALTLGTLVLVSATAAAQDASRPLYEASLTSVDATGVQSPAPRRAVAVEYSDSRVFWVKMGMVAALMINGALLVRTGRDGRIPDAGMRRALRRMTAASLALWFLTTLAGAALPNIG